MAGRQKTFSESWYRIAGQNIRLRTGVRVHRQNFRDQRAFVLENPISNQFFRLRPAAYHFVAGLSRSTTVEEVWQRCLERFPDDAPGQGEVIRLLSQLYHANLLEYDLADDAKQLFERSEKRRQREVRARMLNIMFMRFPLLDPDRFLKRTLHLVGPLFGKLGAIVWIGVVAMAIKTTIDHAPALVDQTQSVLSPSNLLLLYAALAITKTLHEFGHAYACRKFGGEVHTMGIMLLVFTPIPYMDATSSWAFRNRWKRILVASAGMIVEVFVAAVAVFVWAYSSPGAIHNLAYNMIFVASISTVVFNANPLLRFDGYYILSDLLGIPNLHQQAAHQLKYYCKRGLFGLVPPHISPATNSRKEATWLTTFGITSNIYRIFVFAGIILFVADRFLILGVAMAVFCIVGWVLTPLSKLVKYLSSSPELTRNRQRAVVATLVTVAAIVAFLQFVPFPHHFRAPGVVQATTRSQVATAAPGQIARLLAPDGSDVEKDQPLVQLENPELELVLAAARARRAELDAQLRNATFAATADILPVRRAIAAQDEQIAKLENDRANLTVRARHPGIWIAPELDASTGRWVQRGTPLGLVVDPASFEFVSTVAQTDVDRLFADETPVSAVRLPGQSGTTIDTGELRIIPADQYVLPSTALGWTGGGEIMTDADDPEGRRSAEPFFSVIAPIAAPNGANLLHGHAGQIRFHIGARPLLPRWTRSLRQFLQKRYQL